MFFVPGESGCRIFTFLGPLVGVFQLHWWRGHGGHFLTHFTTFWHFTGVSGHGVDLRRPLNAECASSRTVCGWPYMKYEPGCQDQNDQIRFQSWCQQQVCSTTQTWLHLSCDVTTTLHQISWYGMYLPTYITKYLGTYYTIFSAISRFDGMSKTSTG